MADKFFKVEINEKEIIKFLNAKAKQFKNLTPLMKTARVFLKNTVDKNFETQGEHTGEKWEEWSDSYKKWRMKNGKSGNLILTLDGHLRRDVRAKSGADYAMVGVNKIYAALHNFGCTKTIKKTSKNGKRFSCKMNAKKREFMRLDDKARENLLAELYIKSEEMLLDN